MTCKEFRADLETSVPSGLSSSAAASAHIRACADCRSLFEIQLEVAKHLRVVRDTAAQVPESLDLMVLANYRCRIAGQTTRSDAISLRKRIPPKALAWSGAVAAGLLIAGLLTFAVKRKANTTVPPHAVELAKGSQSLNPSTTNTAVLEKKNIKPRTANAPKVRRTQPAVSATATPSLSDGFRSLMYCDQMSCAEAMQVIRVQLPNSFAEPMRTSASTNGVVFADVLVGPDGIARGIRIVE